MHMPQGNSCWKAIGLGRGIIFGLGVAAHKAPPFFDVSLSRIGVV